MIKVGDHLPSATLWEVVPAEDGGLSGPQSIDVGAAVAEKTIVIIGVPGAFTPTCSKQHVPGYLSLVSHFRNLGVDEIWCVSVNDAYVMQAWGAQMGVGDQIRMLADGNAAFVEAMGLSRDLSEKGMGVRSQRYSMLVVNGVVKILNVEPQGKFVVSGAQQLHIQAQGVLDSTQKISEN